MPDTSNYKLYNSQRWRNYSRRYRTICEVSQSEGLLIGITAGDPDKGVVDHIVPINKGGSIWDAANHMGMCQRYHNKKRGLETHGYVVQTTQGEGGLVPLDRNEIIDKLTGVTDAIDEWISSDHKRPGWEGT